MTDTLTSINADAPPNGFKPTEIGRIPEEWNVAKLSSVAETKSGGTPSRTESRFFQGDILWVKSGELDDNIVFNTEEKITQDALKNSSAKIFPKGTLLIALYGATVGRTALLGIEATTNQAVCAIFPKNGDFDPAYLQYYFIGIRPQLLQARYGGAQPNISQTVIKDTVLLLPPLPEQRAIAHVLSKIQAAAQAQAAIAERARELKRALMAKLFTEGLRGEPLKETEIGVMPESWEAAKLADVSEFLQYGTSERCDTEPDGIPVLRIPNVIDGKIDISDLKYLKSPKKASLKLKLEVGDVIFVRTNGRREYVGRCAVFNNELEEALFASYLIRARLKPDSLWPEFFQMYSMTEKGREFLSGKASNAADGKFNINTQTLKAVLLPLPPLDEQREIARILQTVDAKITAAERKRAGLEELFRAMLAELMTGRVRTTALSLSC